MLFEVSKEKAHGCTVYTYAFKSTALGGTWASFGVAIPPKASMDDPVPVIWFLPGIMVGFQEGLTRGGFMEHLATSNVAMIFPDSSPRGTGMPEELDDYRLGPDAAYQTDCTRAPWSNYYRMFTHISEELPRKIQEHGLPIDMSRQSIMGHSGGGHAAMSFHLLLPEKYRSASGIAPYCDLMRSEIGQFVGPKMFKDGYDEMVKRNVPDLIKASKGKKRAIKMLVSIGTADYALRPGSMMVDNLIEAKREAELQDDELKIQYDEGYTHSYFYAATVAKNHVDFHSTLLHALPQKNLTQDVPKTVKDPKPGPWSLRPIWRGPVMPERLTAKQWINGLAECHVALVFVHMGHESQQVRANCQRSADFVATRPYPDSELLIIDVNHHRNKADIERYLETERCTKQYPACWVHGSFCGAMGNLMSLLSGLRSRVGRPGP